MTFNLKRALSYANKGWSVLPVYNITTDGICSCKKGKECPTPGKHPRTNHGYKNATKDKEQITEWWTKYPDANIGIATGNISGIIVIDIDPRNGGNEEFDALLKMHGELPITYEVNTGGGGRHLFFEYPVDINIISKLGSGIDIKGDGGYVVAPPSNHISGGKYKWKKNGRGTSPAVLPKKWIEALSLKEEKKHVVLDEKITQGNRNDVLFKLACSLKSKELHEDEILPSLLAINKSRCKPPLNKDEVKRIAMSVSRYEEGIKWTAPNPLIPLNLQEFPVDVFPLSTRQYIESVAETKQVPIEMPACVAFVSYALAMAGKIQVQAKDDFVENCNLYMMISAETGARKSAVFSEMMHPIEEYQTRESKARKTTIVQYKRKVEMIESRIDRLNTDYARNKKGVTKEEIEREISKLEVEKSELKKVNELTLYTQDITPEVVGILLQDNEERLGILSSEGDLVDVWKGRYDSNGDISLYLKGYTGDAIKVHRVKRAPIILENPLLTILIMAQPIVIEKTLSNEQYNLRGLTGRFLYCLAKDLVGSRKYTDKIIPDALRSKYYNKIKRLLSYKDKTVVGLTHKAKELFIDMSISCEKSLTGRNSSIRGWANRKPGFVLRIAGILHVMEWLESGAKDIPELMSVDTMEKAIKVVDYFTEHSRAAFEHMGHNQAIADAKIILRKITQTGRKELSHNQIYNLCRGQSRFREAKSIDKGLQVLCENGYLKRRPAKNIGPGRPRGDRYLLNPNV